MRSDNLQYHPEPRLPYQELTGLLTTAGEAKAGPELGLPKYIELPYVKGRVHAVKTPMFGGKLNHVTLRSLSGDTIDSRIYKVPRDLDLHIGDYALFWSPALSTGTRLVQVYAVRACRGPQGRPREVVVDYCSPQFAFLTGAERVTREREAIGLPPLSADENDKKERHEFYNAVMMRTFDIEKEVARTGQYLSLVDHAAGDSSAAQVR